MIQGDGLTRRLTWEAKHAKKKNERRIEQLHGSEVDFWRG
jgi:hypothetical protein